MGKLCVEVDVVDERIDYEKEVNKFRSRLNSYLEDTGLGVVEKDNEECECYGCVPGIVFPVDVSCSSGEYKSSYDGHVIVERCDLCQIFSSDQEAVMFLSAVSGKEIVKWYDEGSEAYYHFCIDMTLEEAKAFTLKPECNDDCSYAHALRHLYKAAMELGANHPQTYLHYIKEAHARFGRPWFCKADRCTNQARYDSGYCGICDIQHNGGKGERIDGA